MKETILITGAGSFIARHLIARLESNYNLKMLSRTPKAANQYRWNVGEKSIDKKALDDVQYIVHLAGESISAAPLTEQRKAEVFESRIYAADLLRETLKARKQKLKAFVSASALGYYGFTDNTLEIDENGNKGTGFSADLCEAWEAAADRFRSENVAEHVSKVRVPIVLGNDGGAFPKYKTLVATHPQVADEPNFNGLPWAHVEDVAGVFAFLAEHKLDGVYNSVAPEPASGQDLFKLIANRDAGRNYKIEPFKGKHLVSHKIINAGFQFKYRNIESAVASLYEAQ